MSEREMIETIHAQDKVIAELRANLTATITERDRLASRLSEGIDEADQEIAKLRGAGPEWPTDWDQLRKWIEILMRRMDEKYQALVPRENAISDDYWKQVAQGLGVEAFELEKRAKTVETQLAAATSELQQIDHVMARRPALDQPTRWQNIEKALRTAARADEAERGLATAETELARLRAATTWQPMETAHHANVMLAVRDVVEGWLVGEGFFMHGGWFWSADPDRRIDPTYWMALPAPPPEA